MTTLTDSLYTPFTLLAPPRAILTKWMSVVIETAKQLRAKRRLALELGSLNNRELADIGLSRNDIDYVINGSRGRNTVCG